jgi:hypothetical protein
MGKTAAAGDISDASRNRSPRTLTAGQRNARCVVRKKRRTVRHTDYEAEPKFDADKAKGLGLRRSHCAPLGTGSLADHNAADVDARPDRPGRNHIEIGIAPPLTCSNCRQYMTHLRIQFSGCDLTFE